MCRFSRSKNGQIKRTAEADCGTEGKYYSKKIQVNIVSGTIVIKVSNVNLQESQVNQCNHSSFLSILSMFHVFIHAPNLLSAYYVLGCEICNEGRRGASSLSRQVSNYAVGPWLVGRGAD